MTVSRLKALPTTYRRVQFRSRLEARWAVFFDELNLHWEYEPQGFTLDNRKDKHPDSCYCPDFLVRTPQKQDMWLEIKPHNVTQNDKFDKFKKLIDCQRVYLLSGQPLDVLKQGDLFDDHYYDRMCPRCCGFELDSWSPRHAEEQRFQCFPCDYETPCGGNNKNEYNNLAGIPIEPYKGDLLVKNEYYAIFRNKVIEAAEEARAYRFY